MLQLQNKQYMELSLSFVLIFTPTSIASPAPMIGQFFF